jgi:DNA-binding MarR family transcriptional regulator
MSVLRKEIERISPWPNGMAEALMLVPENAQHLSPTEFKTYAVLCHLGDYDHRTHRWILRGWSQAQLASCVGISPRSVQRPLRELERAGLIIRVPQYHEDGARLADEIQVRWP